MFSIGDTLKQAWYGLWVLIDSLVYSLISIAYQVFSLIAKASLYNSENGDIKVMIDRISVILGIGMLFIIAYNIILNIMNPDKVSSGGDKSMQGIFKNAIIAIVMLTAYTTVFTYMTRIQNHIIDSQVIEKIILGADETNNTSSSDMGSTVAAKIFTTFFYPIDDDGNIVTYEDCENSSLDVCQAYREGVEAAEAGSIITFITNSTLFDSLVKKKPHMKYLYIISTISGIVALLMFVSYVIDIGIRVAKMAFLQIIAPIPIMAYITKPSGGIFSKWLDNLIKTYLSLFMRLITIYFAMFLINILASSMGNNNGGVFGDTSNVGAGIKMFGYLVLILGVLLFAKDAPKLLENLLGTTFTNGFSPKAIAKKLSGVREVPGLGGAIGKGLDKANQGIGAAAGWYGARQAAIKNNRRLEKLQRQGKDTGGLTHMDVNAAGLQGRHNGYKKGGIGQAKSQGENVFQQTYGYGKKQGHNGGFSKGTIADEKYGKMYEKNVKAHAKARNDEIRNKAIGHEIPGKGDVASVRMKATDYINQNAEFAANSQIYDKAWKAVEAERSAKGITYSPEEYKAKINEKLSQISATTSNANEKRAIDSYLSRESVISDYQSSVLTGNKDALAKVDAEADMKTKKIVEQEIKDKGLENVITDATKKAELKNNAIIEVSKQISAVGGDLSKITFSDEAKAQIQKNIKAKAEIEIQNKGGINNISLSQTAETELKNKLLSITQANPNLQSSDISQIEQKLRTEAVTKQVEQSVTQEVVQKQMMDEEYKKQVSSHLYEEKKDDVRNSVREEAKIAAANKIAEGVMNYEEGRIRGNHTKNADGSLDQVYNAEYAQNEKISNDGVKTKSAEDLAWDKIKKAVLDKDKK